MGVFSYIRERVKAAVLQGFGDAFAALRDAEDVPALLEYKESDGHALPAPAPEPENGRARARK
jgi:hypothetical protein